jgi:hypothetical protein
MRQQARNHQTRSLIVAGELTLVLVSIAAMTSQAPAQPASTPPRPFDGASQALQRDRIPPVSRAQFKASPGTFDSPNDAVAALIDAGRKSDLQAVEAVLGPGSQDVVEAGDPVADKLALQRFVAAYDKKSTLVPINAAKTSLHVGDEDWDLPIPLVREGARWRFDVAAGREEVIDRRIGRNESNAVEASRAYVDAQREYASTDRNGDGTLQYAQRFISTPGLKDGLYWPAQSNESPSPLGEFFAKASDEGYFQQAATSSPTRDTPLRARPYYGYYYTILKSQGPSAPGGAYDYVLNGKMIGGFAMVAYPAEYGVSGVMTFVVNHEGVVYQKDLGPDTDYVEITDFDPDSTWRRVEN